METEKKLHGIAWSELAGVNNIKQMKLTNESKIIETHRAGLANASERTDKRHN